MPQSGTEQNQTLAEQWKKAGSYAAPLGPFSNIFSRCVRTIRSDCESAGGTSARNLKASTMQDLRRIFRSPTLQAMFYYALLTFHENELKQEESLSPDRMTAILGCETISSMIALAYLFRRARFISDAENFKRILQPMQNYVDLGHYMGAAVPEISPATGLLTGGMRYLAFAVLLGVNETAFKSYRLHLRQDHLPFDLKFEAKQWGCTHLQIASHLLQAFGFGVPYARAYMEGLDALSHHKLDKRALRFKVAGIWLDSLMVHGHAPETALGDEFLISDTAVQILESQIREILTDGSKYDWLTKSRADLSPEKTPLLFGPGSTLAAGESAARPAAAAPQVKAEEVHDAELHDFEAMQGAD